VTSCVLGYCMAYENITALDDDYDDDNCYSYLFSLIITEVWTM